MNLSGPAGLLILPGSVLIYCLCRDYSPTVNLLTVFLHMDETAERVRLAGPSVGRRSHVHGSNTMFLMLNPNLYLKAVLPLRKLIL